MSHETLEKLGATGMDDDQGFVNLARMKNAPSEAWQHDTARITEAFTESMTPRQRERILVEETIDPSTLPYIFGSQLNRFLLEEYNGMAAPLEPLFRKRTAPDFRTLYPILEEGGTERLEQVAKFGNYPYSDVIEQEWSYSVAKYGRQFRFAWEDLINDDLGLFSRFPNKLAKAAMNTRAYLMSALIWGSTGPNANYFEQSTFKNKLGTVNMGQGTIATGALTIATLTTALHTLTGSAAGYRDVNGEPFLNVPKYLVVGPALQGTAWVILNSTDIRTTSSTVAGNLNYIRNQNLTLIVDPWVPVICTSNAATCWALFSENIPAGEFATLAGHESPEVWMKAPNAMMAGGGDVNPYSGSYDDDALGYRLRTVMGCAMLDPRAGYGSTGAA